MVGGGNSSPWRPTPVKILVLAPGCPLGRLRTHIAPNQLIELQSLDYLDGELRRGGVRWVVIDPMALSSAGAAAAVNLVSRAGVRLLYYSSFAGFDHRRLVEALGSTVPELVFFETDDDWPRLVQLLRRHDDSVVAHVLKGLANQLDGIDYPLRRRTTSLFAWSMLPCGVAEFAADCNMTASSVRRALSRAGLNTPESLLAVARLARAYDELAEPRSELSEIATRYGIGGVRSLERNLRKHCGLTPRAVRRVASTADFAQRLLASCVRR
jgi:AraC-like DNA-binding protein